MTCIVTRTMQTAWLFLGLTYRICPVDRLLMMMPNGWWMYSIS